MRKIRTYFRKEVSIAPLVTFRILFGVMMLASILRFWAKGWIRTLYIEPTFFFSYYGFEWVKPWGEYTYLLFIVCGIAALGVAMGVKYRISATIFFLSFTYIELMDKTTYLNHYYFISLVSFLMIFLPAGKYFSVDTYRNPQQGRNKVPQWTIFSIKLMLSIVYFYAGLAKLNSDWLWNAMPLKIWLPSNSEMPIIGPLLKETSFIYFMSWAGAVYDLIIPFLLFNRRTRLAGFFFVIVFHVFTRMLFQIGMFPYIMICATTIFFSDKYHDWVINSLKRVIKKLFKIKEQGSNTCISSYQYPKKVKAPLQLFFILFFALQLAIPFRYILYPGELFWTEEGFRFSWRVMLMEKAGYTAFIIKDAESGQRDRVEAKEYLTSFQEKQMAFQPDFILEFAHFLAKEYKKKGYKSPQVYAESYVALNGRPSQPYIDSTVDLAKEKESLSPKNFILPFAYEIKGL